MLAGLILVNILPALQNRRPSEVQFAGPAVGKQQGLCQGAGPWWRAGLHTDAGVSLASCQLVLFVLFDEALEIHSNQF